MKKSGASCGLGFNCPADIQSALQSTTVAGFDFLALPILNPRFRIRSDIQRPYSFTRSDLLLTSSEWTSLVVGIMSRHMGLESSSMSVRRTAEDAFQQELNFASHLGNGNRPTTALWHKYTLRVPLTYAYIVTKDTTESFARIQRSPRSGTSILYGSRRITYLDNICYYFFKNRLYMT